MRGEYKQERKRDIFALSWKAISPHNFLKLNSLIHLLLHWVNKYVLKTTMSGNCVRYYYKFPKGFPKKFLCDVTWHKRFTCYITLAKKMKKINKVCLLQNLAQEVGRPYNHSKECETSLFTVKFLLTINI